MKYGRLTVVSRVERVSASRNALWLCRCDCGQDAKVDSGCLQRGTTRSCGCLQRDLLSARQTTHGLSKQPDTLRAIKSFYNARRRCNNPKDKRYPLYGGRGIKMCDRWSDAASFVADMGPCPPGYSLERKNPDLGYSPGNCEWIPMPDQAKNRTTNKLVELGDARVTMSEYARRTGANYGTIKSRMRRKGTVV